MLLKSSEFGCLFSFWNSKVENLSGSFWNSLNVEIVIIPIRPAVFYNSSDLAGRVRIKLYALLKTFPPFIFSQLFVIFTLSFYIVVVSHFEHIIFHIKNLCVWMWSLFLVSKIMGYSTMYSNWFSSLGGLAAKTSVFDFWWWLFEKISRLSLTLQTR